jgi:hypothetical protein
MRRIAFITAAAAVLALPAAALAAEGPYGKRIGGASQTGDLASATTNAKAVKPAAIYLQVTTSPRQPADSNYSVTCSRDSGDNVGQKQRSKDYKAAQTPFVRKLRLPMSNPDECIVIAQAALPMNLDRPELNPSGRITLRLFARRRH